MSYRTIIGNAMKDRLLGNTSAGVRVFTSLDRPLSPDDLPAVIIYTMASKRGKDHYGNALINRIVTLNIEAAITSTPEGALAAAEQLADQIEGAIEADPSLGSVVVDTMWQQTLTDVSAHGAVTLGVVLLEYEVEYLTARNLEPLLGADQPIPTQVFIDATTTAQAYVDPLMAASTGTDGQATYWGTEGQIIPPTVDAGVVSPSRSPEPPKVTCDGDSCDIDAWQGDAP